MSKIFIVTNCASCPNFVWDEGDMGQCFLIGMDCTFYPDSGISTNCPLPDAPDAEDDKEEA